MQEPVLLLEAEYMQFIYTNQNAVNRLRNFTTKFEFCRFARLARCLSCGKFRSALSDKPPGMQATYLLPKQSLEAHLDPPFHSEQIYFQADLTLQCTGQMYVYPRFCAKKNDTFDCISLILERILADSSCLFVIVFE